MCPNISASKKIYIKETVIAIMQINMFNVIANFFFPLFVLFCRMVKFSARRTPWSEKQQTNGQFNKNCFKS